MPMARSLAADVAIEPLAVVVRRAIEDAVAITGSTEAAAEALGIGWATVKRKMAAYAYLPPRPDAIPRRELQKSKDYRRAARRIQVEAIEDELDTNPPGWRRLELEAQLTRLLAEEG